MDCVLCVYDFKSMTLEFAAANNPLWLIRNGELSVSSVTEWLDGG